MIISCTNCKKKFKVEDRLIPQSGRKIQCGVCKHLWFFKNDIFQQENDFNKENNLKEEKLADKIINDHINQTNLKEKIIEDKLSIKDFKNEKSLKKSNILNKIISYLVVFIISFVALIIVLDTFKTQLSNILPNLELFLFNLYETFEDIGLFLKDLIK